MDILELHQVFPTKKFSTDLFFSTYYIIICTSNLTTPFLPFLFCRCGTTLLTIVLSYQQMFRRVSTSRMFICSLMKDHAFSQKKIRFSSVVLNFMPCPFNTAAENVLFPRAKWSPVVIFRQNHVFYFFLKHEVLSSDLPYLCAVPTFCFDLELAVPLE